MRDKIKETIKYVAYELNRGADCLDGWDLDAETKQEVCDCLDDVADEAANFKARMEEIEDRLEDAYNRASKENA